MKLLVETDVLIDHIVRQEGHGSDVRRLLVMASFGDAELQASAQTICDVECVVADRYDAAFARRSLRALCEVLHVCAVTPEQVEAALREDAEGFDAHLAVLIAREIDADAIVTRDRARYDGTSCKVLSPAEVVAHMRDEYGLTYDEIAIVGDTPRD